MNQPPPTEKQTGKRIVSKGEYAFIRRQEAVKFAIAFCFGGIAFIALLVGILVGVRVGIDALDGIHRYPDGSMAARWVVIGSLSSIVALACFRSLRGTVVDAGLIELGSLFTPANTADLPAPDTLVRASEEPVQEPQAVLLRAATESVERRAEQLVRASAGGTEQE